MSVAFASELQHFRQQLAVIEQDLQAARQAHGLLQAFAEPLFVLDAEATVTFVNGPGIAWLGYPAEPPVGRAVGEVLPEAVGRPLLTVLAEETGGERLASFEVYEPGRDAWLGVRVHRSAAEVVVELQSVTERKQAEAEQHTTLVRLRQEHDAGAAALKQVWDELAAEKARAVAAASARGAFLAALIEDVRRPVDGILGMAELLPRDASGGVPSDGADVIHAAAESLLLQLESVDALALLEAGVVDPACEPFGLHSVIEATVEAVQWQAQARRLEVACTFVEGIPHTLDGDATRLRQIVGSLLIHAIGRAGNGAIALTLDAERGAQRMDLICTVCYPTTGLRVNAAGERLRSATDGPSGLSLMVGERLAEALGGQVVVRHEAETTTLTAILPFGVPASQQDADDAPVVLSEPCPMSAATPLAGAGQEANPVLDGRRVLIVDGNNPHCWLLRDQVEAWGMVAYPFCGAEEAVSWLERVGTCDLVIIDDELPGVEASALAARLKALRPGLLTIMVSTDTASTDTLTESTGAAPTVDAWIVKPYRQRLLRDTMVRLLTERAAETEAGTGDAPWGLFATDDPVLDFLDEILAACRHAVDALEQHTAEAGDAGAVEAALRALQVNCQMLDVPVLLDLCTQLEQAYQEDPAAMARLLERLGHELATLTDRIERHQGEPAKT